MVKIFSNSTGRLIAIYDDDGLKKWGAPTESIYTLEFDETTNTLLWHDLDSNYPLYCLLDSNLTRDGQPVTINPPTEQHQAEAEAGAGYAVLPDWAKTGTAAQAETYIANQIFSGQTQTQIEAYIDAQLTNITTANVSQINARLTNLRALLKLTAGAVIAMRGLFIITAKLLIYVRDLVIRFRK